MKIIKRVVSKDRRTVKYLQQTNDGLIIESSYFNLDEHIICISTQVGCMMGCIFCATSFPLGKKRFVRNLTDREIVQQVENVIDDLNENKLRRKKILFSYMGMGEPMLNYNNVIKSIRILTKKYPNSRVTISTSGVSPELIKKLAKERRLSELKLHLSLHAPNDKLRKRIMPRTKPVKVALDALRFFSITKGIPAKVNYVLISNVNDSEANARELATLLRGYPFIVKLSRLNICKDFRPSSSKTLKMFEKILRSSGIKTCRFFRRSYGNDIGAGCGQLRLRCGTAARREVG